MNAATGSLLQFPHLLDNSMLSASACKKKFFYEYCRRLAPPQKSIHLHAGGVLAEALQVARIAYFRDGRSAEDALRLAIRAAIRYWGDYPEPTGDKEKYKDFINVAAAIIDYFRQYPLDTDHIRPYIRENGEPAVEFTFAIPIPVLHPETGNPLLYGGRSDMVGVYAGLNCIVDEKTTYSFTSNWTKQFLMRGQFIGYCWAGQQTGLRTSTIIVRGIAIQQREIKHLEFGPFAFPQWQIDRWYEQMLMKVRALVEAYEDLTKHGVVEDEAFPLNFGEVCSSFGGCPMMDLCTSEQPEVWFPTYVPNVWNPLHKDPTKEKELLVEELMK